MRELITSVDIQQEMERQQHRRELRDFRWTEIIRPLAEQIKRELLDDRPFLKDDKAWELAKDKAWARYNSERKAKKLGITFK
jgi:hypothetical protein